MTEPAEHPPLDYLAVPTLGDLLIRARARYGERPALTLDGQTATYAALHERAMLIARALLGLGVRPGHRVGLFTSNCIEFVESWFAVALVGAVAVPINSRFRTRELRHVFLDADLRVILTSTADGDGVDHAARTAEVTAELGPEQRPTVAVLGSAPSGRHPAGFLDEATLLAHAEAAGPADVDRARRSVRLRDVAAVLYTSGTTSVPKGCVHTHEALVRNGMVTGRTRFLLTEQTRFWDPLPMFHVSFLTPLIACTDAGAHLISMGHFDGESALEVIERERADWLFAAFPAIAQGLLDAPSFGRRDLSGVRMTMCIGPTPTRRRFRDALAPAALLSTYGSTETGGVITYHEPAATADERITTAGTPFAGVELAIRSIDGPGMAATGELGEILVRGYSILDGYLNDPVATAAALDDERWLHTGDLGLLDASGHLSFCGRLKDMLKVGGENVSAAEVEELLTEHPQVIAAQVVGAPDARLDEVVAAFVELSNDAPVSEQEIIDFCVGKIASFKVPRHVRFVTAWPMSATKIRKQDLADRIARELAPAGPNAGKAPQ